MALTLGFGELGLSGIVKRQRKYERIMPKSQQVAKIKQMLISRGINVRVGDVEDLVDSSLHYDENKREILKYYGIALKRPSERQFHEMQCSSLTNQCVLDGVDVCELACEECNDKSACKKADNLKAEIKKYGRRLTLMEHLEKETPKKKVVRVTEKVAIKKPKVKVKVKKIIHAKPKVKLSEKVLTDNQIQHIRKHGYVNVTIEGVKKHVTKRNYASRSKTVNWYKSGGKVSLKVVRGKGNAVRS